MLLFARVYFLYKNTHAHTQKYLLSFARQNERPSREIAIRSTKNLIYLLPSVYIKPGKYHSCRSTRAIRPVAPTVYYTRDITRYPRVKTSRGLIECFVAIIVARYDGPCCTRPNTTNRNLIVSRSSITAVPRERELARRAIPSPCYLLIAFSARKLTSPLAGSTLFSL